MDKATVNHQGSTSAEPPKSRLTLPFKIPQPTFPEAKAQASAIAHGPVKDAWVPMMEKPGLIYSDHPFTVELEDPTAEFGSYQQRREELEAGLKTFTASSVILLCLLLQALQQEQSVRVDLDELVGWLGWRPNTKSERREMKRTVWRWLQLYDLMFVRGTRIGTYKGKESTSANASSSSREKSSSMGVQTIPRLQFLLKQALGCLGSRETEPSSGSLVTFGRSLASRARGPVGGGLEVQRLL